MVSVLKSAMQKFNTSFQSPSVLQTKRTKTHAESLKMQNDSVVMEFHVTPL